VGRESGQVRFEVCRNTKKATIQPKIEAGTEKGATIYTDESHAYNGVGHPVGHTTRSTIRQRNMPGTTMGTAFAKSTAIRRKAYGRG
jgi:transposase-like protein